MDHGSFLKLKKRREIKEQEKISRAIKSFVKMSKNINNHSTCHFIAPKHPLRELWKLFRNNFLA